MSNRQVEEIRIPVPWGHIAGKWWGPKDIRPILALHGREDNAGSFDRIIPLLPEHLSYLALDMPGHGDSSHIANGEVYTQFGMMNAINIVFDIFKWDKVSLMTHSMSSMISYTLLPCIADKVDLFITLDGLKPHVWPANIIFDMWTRNLNETLIADKRNRESNEPPSYTYDELVRKYVDAAEPSVTAESADYIVRRGVKPSKLNPGKFYFSRDRRTKSLFYVTLAHSFGLDIARKFRFPFCFIRANRHLAFIQNQQTYWDETIDVMKTENPKFEVHNIDGDHFVHLSEPEKISQILCDFLNKYRLSPVKADSKL